MFRSKLWALVALVACGILPPDEGALAETPNQWGLIGGALILSALLGNTILGLRNRSRRTA